MKALPRLLPLAAALAMMSSGPLLFYGECLAAIGLWFVPFGNLKALGRAGLAAGLLVLAAWRTRAAWAVPETLVHVGPLIHFQLAVGALLLAASAGSALKDGPRAYRLWLRYGRVSARPQGPVKPGQPGFVAVETGRQPSGLTAELLFFDYAVNEGERPVSRAPAIVGASVQQPDGSWRTLISAQIPADARPTVDDSAPSDVPFTLWQVQVRGSSRVLLAEAEIVVQAAQSQGA